jgi:hypothetical protein
VIGSTLREMTTSYVFWPGAALFGVAVWMAVWAATLYQVDWLGQGIWATLAMLASLAMLAFAFRETRPQASRTYR